jgi:hypothetical protein
MSKVKIDWGKEENLFPTKRISLWPSLFINENGRHYLSWYEYNSYYYTSPSDIYCSLSTRDGKFRRKARLTHYPSYDNGPCITKDINGRTFVTWHSWRPPGRGPFIKDSAENIWMKEGSFKKSWSEARLLFPAIERTSYSSMIQTKEGKYIMALTIEKVGILLSQSEDAVIWSKPEFLPFSGKNNQRADIIQDKNGVFWIFFEGMESTRSVIKFSFSKDLSIWSPPGIVPFTEGAQRPKASVDLRGRFCLSWYTSHWGSTEFSSHVNHKNELMEIEIEADNTGGNSCWALNYLKITGANIKKEFDFGSEEIKSNTAQKVTSKTKLYSRKAGFGFTKKVKDLVRAIGSGVTSDLVYAKGGRCFKVDIPPCNYNVTFVFSSWIASTKKIRVKVNGSVLINTFNRKDCDKVYGQFSINGHDWFKPILVSGSDVIGDRNRPSKIIEQKDIGYWVVYTAFKKSGVNIVRKLGKIVT